MKIATTYENGRIFEHFGKCKSFKIYTIEDNKVESEEVISSDDKKHNELAMYLKLHGVDTLICGFIGQCAKDALSVANIQLCAGVSGSADEAVETFLKGKLVFDNTAKCEHGHLEGNSCGADCPH